MCVANLVQHLMREAVGLGANIRRLFVGAPIKCATIESVAGGAGGLKQPGTSRRIAFLSVNDPRSVLSRPG
jgi:hypothetical protein